MWAVKLVGENEHKFLNTNNNGIEFIPDTKN